MKTLSLYSILCGFDIKRYYIETLFLRTIVLMSGTYPYMSILYLNSCCCSVALLLPTYNFLAYNLCYYLSYQASVLGWEIGPYQQRNFHKSLANDYTLLSPWHHKIDTSGFSYRSIYLSLPSMIYTLWLQCYEQCRHALMRFYGGFQIANNRNFWRCLRLRTYSQLIFCYHRSIDITTDTWLRISY